MPARAGSKRLTDKNVRLLGGRPLLWWSIEDGLEAETVDRVIVSTDSEEIAELARQGGAEVPFLRPAEMATDKASDTPFMSQAAQWLEENEGYSPDALVLLRPTSPFRPPDLIDRCVRTLLETGADSVRSMMPVGVWHPYWMVRVGEDGRTGPFMEGKDPGTYYQTQLLPPLHTHDAYCDVTRRRNLPLDCPPDATLAGFYGDDCRAVINTVDFVVNIDSDADLRLAEAMLASGAAECRQPQQAVET